MHIHHAFSKELHYEIVDTQCSPQMFDTLLELKTFADATPFVITVACHFLKDIDFSNCVTLCMLVSP